MGAGPHNREAEITTRMAQDRAAREAEADRLIEAFKQDKGGDKDEASRFQEAVSQYGGRNKLMQEILRERVAGAGGMVDAATGKITFGGREDAERARRFQQDAAMQVQRGMQGRLGAGEQLPQGFVNTLEVVKHEKEVKGILEAQAESKREKEKRNKKIDDQNELGAKYEKEFRLDMLRQQKEDLEKQFAREKHALTGPQRQQLEDAIIGSKTPKEAQIMSSKAYADLALTSGANRIPEKQLDKLTNMDRSLKAIEKEIKNVGRLQ
jgi:hypothetical protein